MTKFSKVIMIISLVSIIFVSCSTDNKKSSISINETVLPYAVENTDYSFKLTASGGSSNYRWQSIGTPIWLKINPNTGELSGKPPLGISFSKIETFYVEIYDISNSNLRKTEIFHLAVLNTVNPVDSLQSLGNEFTNGIAAFDVDGDDDIDLVFGNYGDPNLGLGEPNKVFLNDGMGNFSDSGQNLGHSMTNRLTFGDIDKDGDIDFVCANNGPNSVWMNNGIGTFSNSQNLGIANSIGLKLADFDADGFLDLVFANHSACKIYMNDGTGNFTDSGQNLSNPGDNAECVTTGDVDNDGDIDIVFGNGVMNPNTVFLNDGNGNFTDSGQRLGDSVTGGIELADADLDGDLDIFASNFFGGTEVWLNSGTGIFTKSQQNLGTSNSASLSVCDLEGDGDYDIVEANFFNQGNKIWLNDGNGNFADSNKDMGSSTTTSMALADFDNDGDVDFAFANGDTLNSSSQPNTIFNNK